jgi:alpha-glucosidase
MQDVLNPPDETQDPAEKRQPGIGMGRDPERTPMPWSTSRSWGFSEGRPWLPIGEANQAVNVEFSRNDPNSLLSFYRRLLQLRRAEPVLVSGDLTGLHAEDGVIQFVRSGAGKRFAIVVNLVNDMRRVAVDTASIVACTDLSREGEEVREAVQLAPAEAMILLLA